MTDTQLTVASGYDTSKMIFSDPVDGKIPNSTLTYKRILISTLNKDGTTGDLILPTSELFSFGVSENKDMSNPDKVNGHVLPLCMWSRDGATPEEKEWTNTLDNIVKKCQEHLISVKEELKQPDLMPSDLRKMNPLYIKKNPDGTPVEGRGPTLYVKLIQTKKKNQPQSEAKILSMFFNEKDESINPLDLLGKYCYVKAAIKIESIFIGGKITLQIKLYEATVRLMSSGMKRLLPRKRATDRLLAATSNPMMEHDDEEDVDADAGSIVGSDNEEEKPKPVKKPPVKKVVTKKRVVTKVGRKVKK